MPSTAWLATGSWWLGPTIYRYVTGSMPAVAAWWHVAGAVAVLVVVLQGLRRLAPATKAMDRAIALGLIVSLLLAYLAGGSRVLEPSTERYGMFLVVPTCYVLATCIDAFASSPGRAALVRASTAALGAALLGAFALYFLAPLYRYDAGRHVTYRTGEIEPKKSAFAGILARRSPERVTLVNAEDWWLYWPLRYLAGARPDLLVTMAGALRTGRPFPPDFRLPAQHAVDAEVFGVAWAGSARDAEFARRAADHFDVGGYEPGPILRVHRLREAAEAAALDASPAAR